MSNSGNLGYNIKEGNKTKGDNLLSKEDSCMLEITRDFKDDLTDLKNSLELIKNNQTDLLIKYTSQQKDIEVLKDRLANYDYYFKGLSFALLSMLLMNIVGLLMNK